MGKVELVLIMGEVGGAFCCVQARVGAFVIDVVKVTKGCWVAGR